MVEIGQRLRDASKGLFGQLGTEFVVLDVYRGVHGIEHAKMVSATDESVVKTIAVGVLRDRRRYALIARA
jgi:hypothetical protein